MNVVIAWSEATKQSSATSIARGLLRFARNDEAASSHPDNKHGEE
jgi:hypothetical protein